MKLSKAAFAAVGAALLLATPALANDWKMDAVSNQVSVIQEAQDLQETDRREFLCLSLAIYHEAHGRPRDDLRAVGHVVKNRTRDPRYPKGVCRVVWQSGQFSWSVRPVGAIIPKDKRSWEAAQRSALDLGDDLTKGATSFFNIKTDPVRLRPKGRRTLVLGPHVFVAR